jgi:hypothetical protein
MVHAHSTVTTGNRDADPPLRRYRPRQSVLDGPGLFHRRYLGNHVPLGEIPNLGLKILMTPRGELAGHATFLAYPDKSRTAKPRNGLDWRAVAPYHDRSAKPIKL